MPNLGTYRCISKHVVTPAGDPNPRVQVQLINSDGSSTHSRIVPLAEEGDFALNQTYDLNAEVPE